MSKGQSSDNLRLCVSMRNEKFSLSPLCDQAAASDNLLYIRGALILPLRVKVPFFSLTFYLQQIPLAVVPTSVASAADMDINAITLTYAGALPAAMAKIYK